MALGLYRGAVGGRSVMFQASLRLTYKAMRLHRLWRSARDILPAVAAAVTLGLMTSACSFTYQLGSLFGNDEDKSEQTGSVGSSPAAVPASAETPQESDLAYARAAAADVLSRGGKDASAPWTNPRTGARGTVTPLATAYTQDGFVCRDFLASYVRQGSEAWLQGEACRLHQGKWEVRKLRPWKKS